MQPKLRWLLTARLRPTSAPWPANQRALTSSSSISDLPSTATPDPREIDGDDPRRGPQRREGSSRLAMLAEDYADMVGDGIPHTGGNHPSIMHIRSYCSMTMHPTRHQRVGGCGQHEDPLGDVSWRVPQPSRQR